MSLCQKKSDSMGWVLDAATRDSAILPLLDQLGKGRCDLLSQDFAKHLGNVVR